MKIDQYAREALTTHARICYPNESCGLIVSDTYHPCNNIHEQPTKAFRIDPKDTIRLSTRGEIQAICHSHPYSAEDTHLAIKQIDPRWPSLRDQKEWIEGNTPWIIVATDGEGVSDPIIMDEQNPAPLLEREFIWGYQDCYSLVRDYYKLNLNITLMHYPRDWKWWEEPNKDLFMEQLAYAGFKRIPEEKADIHDVCFFKRESKVVNHLGIISGQNELMQQGVGALSKICRLDRYQRDVMMYARHISQFKEQN